MTVSPDYFHGGGWRFALATAVACALAACEGASAQPVDDAAPDESAATAAQPPSARASRVEVATIEQSEASLEISLPGEVDGARDALLASPLGGFVEAVHVEDGQSVKKGKPLVHVDTASHSARAAQAQVELETAARELKRAKLLGDALPGAELDAAEARHKAAKAAVWTTQVAASRAVISAPFDGVVVDVDAEVGEVAAPGTPLVRVVQLDPAVVTVSLTDRDVVAVKDGQKAKVTIDARSGFFEGVVKRVQPAADLKTRSFTAEIEIDNADGKLLPGMIVRAELDVEGDGSQLFISQDWLVTGLERMGVFVVDAEGKARFREVKLGPVVRRQVVVEQGLSAGDQLVVTGHRELADGDPVLISRKGVCCDNGRVKFD